MIDMSRAKVDVNKKKHKHKNVVTMVKEEEEAVVKGGEFIEYGEIWRNYIDGILIKGEGSCVEIGVLCNTLGHGGAVNVFAYIWLI